MVSNFLTKLQQNVPLSLYVHLPWCIRKCPYCDFNSHATEDKIFPEEQYVDALLRDLQYVLPHIDNRQVNSIFFGGGTPSLFSAAALRRLLFEFDSALDLRSGIEVTLEANPGTTDSERFNAYREAGVNRLSIGVQSFSDEKLNVLGRIHNGQDAKHAVHTALAAGFENINIDLMYALPGQSLAEALEDIKRAIDHEPQHISWYQLTIEPNTVFYSQPPVLPDEDLNWEIQERGQELLADSGYQRYEISAYARDGKQCTHNMNYWQFGDYLGLGAGAHGKITEHAGIIKREARHRIPQAYMDKAGDASVIVDERKLHTDDIVFEFMLNALRLNEGFTSDLFEQRTAISIGAIEKQLNYAEERGLLMRDKDIIRPTEAGNNYLNDLLEIFMSDTDSHTGVRLH